VYVDVFICEGKLRVFHVISNEVNQMELVKPVARLCIYFHVSKDMSRATISISSDIALLVKDEHLLLSLKENQRIMLRKIKCRI
jgi:hypothetical protein